MDLLKLILRILKGAEAIQTGPLQTLRVGLTSHKSLSSMGFTILGDFQGECAVTPRVPEVCTVVCLWSRKTLKKQKLRLSPNYLAKPCL